jgi:RES domain-containing protein
MPDIDAEIMRCPHGIKQRTGDGIAFVCNRCLGEVADRIVELQLRVGLAKAQRDIALARLMTLHIESDDDRTPWDWFGWSQVQFEAWLVDPERVPVEVPEVQDV